MLSPQDIAAIRERAEKATAGPWEYEQYELGPFEDTAKLYYSGSDKPFADFRGDLNQDQDAEFIAHARTDIPALLAHVEELEEKLATPDISEVDGIDTSLSMRQQYLMERRIPKDLDKLKFLITSTRQ